MYKRQVSDIRSIGRVTQGVKLVKLDQGASISSITRVISEDAETKEPITDDTSGSNEEEDNETSEE